WGFIPSADWSPALRLTFSPYRRARPSRQSVGGREATCRQLQLRHVEFIPATDPALNASAPLPGPSRPFGESSDALPSGHDAAVAVPNGLRPRHNAGRPNCDIPTPTHGHGSGAGPDAQPIRAEARR